MNCSSDERTFVHINKISFVRPCNPQINWSDRPKVVTWYQHTLQWWPLGLLPVYRERPNKIVEENSDFNKVLIYDFFFNQPLQVVFEFLSEWVKILGSLCNNLLLCVSTSNVTLIVAGEDPWIHCLIICYMFLQVVSHWLFTFFFVFGFLVLVCLSLDLNTVHTFSNHWRINRYKYHGTVRVGQYWKKKVKFKFDRTFDRIWNKPYFVLYVNFYLYIFGRLSVNYPHRD